MKEAKHIPVPWGDDLEAWLEVRNAEQIESDIRAYAAQAVAAERERYIKIMQMIDTHYSGSLDYQPAYVKAARQVLDVIDWPNA